jgi:hypothetical protein
LACQVFYGSPFKATCGAGKRDHGDFKNEGFAGAPLLDYTGPRAHSTDRGAHRAHSGNPALAARATA